MGILKDMGVPYEHSPTGIDTMTLIIDKNKISSPGTVNEIVRELDKRFNKKSAPMEIEVGEAIAMVGIAGLGMKRDYESHINGDARVLQALANAGIRQRVLNKGASEISFFVGVGESQADDAVRVIYNEFYGR